MWALSFEAGPTLALAKLADSPWPIFHGDRKLTGQSKYDTSKIQGGTKWKFQAEGQVETSPVIDSSGNIYFVDHKCNLYSINNSGKENWKFKAGNPITSKEWGGESCAQSTPAIASDGTIYFLPMSGNFYAVDSSGKEKWHYPVFTFKNAWPSPAIGLDGTIYVGSELYPPPETGKPQEKSAQFYAFNPDGTLKWSYDTNFSSWVNSTPTIDDNGTVYVSLNDCKNNCLNSIFAFNPDGTIEWKFAPPNGALEGSVAIGSDGTLYFTAKGTDDPRKANFYALTSEGKEKWKVSIENGVSITPGLSKDGKIYFGDWGGIFYALDQSGKELWRVQTPTAYESLSSSPAIGSDGTIYFGTLANYFYAYTPEGKEKWKIDVGNGGIDSSPAIGSDGTVYFTTVKGELWAIGEKKINQDLQVVSNTASPSNQNNNKFNKTLITILVIIILACILLMFFLIKRHLLTKKRLILVLSILIFLLGALAYLLFFNNNQQINNNNDKQNLDESQSKTKEDYKGECPRRVYGAPDSGYYGVFEMQQFDLTSEEVEWTKKNCPDAYWAGTEGTTGQPGIKGDGSL